MTSSKHTDAFVQSASDVAGEIRRTLAAALHACNCDPAKPQAMGRQLRIDKSLAWKIARVVSDEQPLAAVSRLPGRSGTRLMFAALKMGGASQVQLDALQSALNRFEEFIETHAGDRETFEIMLTGVIPSAPDREEQFRKLAFHGNSAVFGVQARAQLGLHFVCPSKTDPTRLDIAIVSGLLDLVRLRPDTPWAIATVAAIDDKGNERVTGKVHPIDEQGLTPDGLPLLRDFCSKDLPRVRSRKTYLGPVKYDVEPTAMGFTGAVDCVAGWYRPATVPIARSATDHLGQHIITASTPCESLLFELFVHKSMTFAQKPTFHAYSQLPGGLTYPQDGLDIAELQLATVQERFDLADGFPQEVDAESIEVLRHDDLVTRVFERLGRDRSEFALIRTRIKYPPVPSRVLLRYELPEHA